MDNKENDSIDFYELFFELWNKKWIILFLTLSLSILSIIHAYSKENVYRVETILLPSKFDHNPWGNISSNDNKNLYYEKRNYRESFMNIFEKYKKNLLSKHFQKMFVEENKLYQKINSNTSSDSEQIEIYKSFSSSIKINEKNNFFIVSLESGDPHFAAKTLNDFIKFINKMTVNRQTDIARKKINDQIIDIEYSIKSKRDMAKLRREDQISRFNEALAIAESLGYKSRVDATNIIQNTSKIHSDITAASTPLYYIGTRALSAEIDILENRKTDDPFIRGLRDLQEKLTFLKSIDLTKEGFNAVTIDQKAHPPKTPIRPDRKLIISIGSSIGLFIAIILVIIFSSIKRQTAILIKKNKK